MENRQSDVIPTCEPSGSRLRLHALTVALGLLLAPIASAQSAFIAGGQELSSALKEYAQKKGWSVQWAGEDYFLETDLLVPGTSVADDVEFVLQEYRRKGGLQGYGARINEKRKLIELIRDPAQRVASPDPVVAHRMALARATPSAQPGLPMHSSAGVNRAPALALGAAPAAGARVPAGPSNVASASVPTSAVAPAAPAPIAPQHHQFKVQAGELMSETLERWVKGTGFSIVWESPTDLRMQANATFQAASVVDAIEQFSEVVARSKASLRVRSYRNGVIRVMESNQ